MQIFNSQFKRDEHVYRNDKFAEFLKDAVLFFHGTPATELPPPGRISGAGVYAIYCAAGSRTTWRG